MSICSVLPILPAGYLSDRFGRRKMIFLGIFAYVVGIAFLAMADDLPGFYLGVSIWGFGHALYMPSFMGFLSEKVDESRRKYLFSYQMFAGMLASATTVLIIGFLPSALSGHMNVSEQLVYRGIFIMGLCFSMLQLLPLLLTKKEKTKAEKKDLLHAEEGGGVPPVPKRTLLKLCIPMALLGLGAGLIVPFFQVFFQWKFGTKVEDIGILWAATQFLWAAAYLVMPKIAKRRGSVGAITTVHAAEIIALVGIPASPNFLIITIPYITRMVLMNMTWPIFQSFSLSQVPEEHRSLTISSTNLSFNATKAVTPFVAGYIFEVSLEIPFIITAVLYTIATTAFYLFFRKRDDKDSEQPSYPKTLEDEI